jgi:hypothetical protein
MATVQPQPAQPQSTSEHSLSVGLDFAVAGLGVVIFLLGLLPDTTYDYTFLFAGLLAGLSRLPKQEWTGVAAAAAVAGFLSLVFPLYHDSFDIANVPISGGTYAELVLGFIQAALAVVAVLLRSGVITPPVATRRRGPTA